MPNPDNFPRLLIVGLLMMAMAFVAHSAAAGESEKNPAAASATATKAPTYEERRIAERCLEDGWKNLCRFEQWLDAQERRGRSYEPVEPADRRRQNPFDAK
jgi:hypothetical protein